MKKDRLLKLAEVLENFNEERRKLVVPVDRFDLVNWFRHTHKAPGSKGCGTTACAVGVAMLHPWFQRRGLVPRHPDRVTREPQPGEVLGTYAGVRGSNNPDSDHEFFDLNDREFTHLFMPDSYSEARRGPKSVAKRIREFVASGGLVPA